MQCLFGCVTAYKLLNLRNIINKMLNNLIKLYQKLRKKSNTEHTKKDRRHKIKLFCLISFKLEVRYICKPFFYIDFRQKTNIPLKKPNKRWQIA